MGRYRLPSAGRLEHRLKVIAHRCTYQHDLKCDINRLCRVEHSCSATLMPILIRFCPGNADPNVVIAVTDANLGKTLLDWIQEPMDPYGRATNTMRA
jgi:hypothetical protein